jgi:hypothetical protein
MSELDAASHVYYALEAIKAAQSPAVSDASAQASATIAVAQALISIAHLLAIQADVETAFTDGVISCLDNLG